MTEVYFFAGGLLLAVVLFMVYTKSVHKRLIETEKKLASKEQENASLESSLLGKEEILKRSDLRLEQLIDEKGALREKLVECEVRLEGEVNRRQEQTESLGEMKKNLKLEFEELARKILGEKSAEQNKGLNNLLSPLMKEIGDFRKKVQDSYEKEAKERHSLKNEIVNLQALNTKMSQEAVNLTRALKGDNRSQGAWGELILESVLEASGLSKGREYIVQESFKNEDGNRLRPDVLVHLPEGKDIVIDSKVSLKAYESYSSELDEEKRSRLARAHVESVKAHIDSLSKKSYEHLPAVKTLDYVLLFMPVEGAFRLAMEMDSTLFVEAMKKNVVLVSPSTLLVTLRTVNQIWKYENQNQNARAIASKAEILHRKFVLFVEEMQKSGQAINQAQRCHETAVKRLSSGRNNLVKLSEDLKDLGVPAKSSLSPELLAGSSENEEVVNF